MAAKEVPTGSEPVALPPYAPGEHEIQGDFSAFGHVTVNIPELAYLARLVSAGTPLTPEGLRDLHDLVKFHAPEFTQGTNRLALPSTVIKDFKLDSSTPRIRGEAKPGIMAIVGLAGEFGLQVQEADNGAGELPHQMALGVVAYLGQRGVDYQLVAGQDAMAAGLIIDSADPGDRLAA